MTNIQKILEIGLEEYLKKHKTIGYKQKVIKAIRNCKSDKMGAHKYVCDGCGYEEIAYNSCRNRHCPNCQTGKKLKWVEARKEEVLNIKYYHVVFTIPSEIYNIAIQNQEKIYKILFKATSETLLEARKEEVLNIKYYHVVFTIPSEIYNIAIQNQEKIYKILFKATSETLQELAKDEKYLGGEIGFFSILHTWGQNLMYHPHIHCVVTGGGLTELGKWVEKEEDFFIPVKVMSRKFRGKFLSYIRETKLEYYGKNKELENPAIYNDLINQMYNKEWIVYCKEPFQNANSVIQYLGRYTHRVAISNERIVKIEDGKVTFNNKEWIVYCKEPFQNANSVIQYLGRYTHRVAISNERIVKIEDGKVTFKWRDYKDKNKMKEMTVTIEEFIRRFLIHILPPRFMKIRYYGILGNRNKKKKLLKCKILTRTKIYKKKELPALELLKKVLGKDFNLCPQCKKGHMLMPNTT